MAIYKMKFEESQCGTHSGASRSGDLQIAVGFGRRFGNRRSLGFRSFHIRKIDVGRHTGPQSVLLIFEAHFHTEDLFDPIFHGLDVAWRKLGLAIDLLDDAGKIAVQDYLEAVYFQLDAQLRLLQERTGRK